MVMKSVETIVTVVTELMNVGAPVKVSVTPGVMLTTVSVRIEVMTNTGTKVTRTLAGQTRGSKMKGLMTAAEVMRGNAKRAANTARGTAMSRRDDEFRA